jgi:hypothetical protein
MPGLARADDGVVGPLSSVTTLTDTAPDAIADEALAVAEEAAAALGPLESPDVAAVGADPAEVSEAGADAAVAEAPVFEPVAPPAAEPDPAAGDAIEPDTTVVADDTASDTPPPAESGDSVEEPPAPEYEPPVTEAPPAARESSAQGTTTANVNVSVRIGSPGDNGSVTQLNVVSHPPTAQPRDDTTHASPQDAGEQSASTAGTADTWYWRWDCLGVDSPGAISPIGSPKGSIPTSWTWVWNCGDNSSQYHGESDTGYRQTNANVAIRIESPGSDGPVTQVNVGAGAHFSRPTPPLPSLPVPATPVPSVGLGTVLDRPMILPVPVVIGDIALPPPVSAPGAPLPSETFTQAPLLSRPADLEQPRTAARLPFGADVRVSRPLAASAADRPVEVSPVAPGRGLPGVASGNPRLETSGRAASRPSPDAALKKRPAPRWHPSPPHRSAPAPLSTASAAAAAGGGSSGSGLPFLLALPFVAALLDLARRVALEHTTWPSGHRRRVPDRPG